MSKFQDILLEIKKLDLPMQRLNMKYGQRVEINGHKGWTFLKYKNKKSGYFQGDHSGDSPPALFSLDDVSYVGCVNTGWLKESDESLEDIYNSAKKYAVKNRKPINPYNKGTDEYKAWQKGLIEIYDKNDVGDDFRIDRNIG